MTELAGSATLTWAARQRVDCGRAPRRPAQARRVGGAAIPVTISLGVAARRGIGETDGDCLIQAAGAALHRAKAAGRNRVEIAAMVR